MTTFASGDISTVWVDGRIAIALTECPGRTVACYEAVSRIVGRSPSLVLSLVEEHEIEGVQMI
ncbi:hypothetical protein PTKU64_85130 [Paraburkholderia terrae]|uniref:Uncharacterized protein n=1 Tax=Paraburkholderia terrae TaxID=311230 RepID=A0ABM7U0I3_9BURK|nr:hypothetical protein PTKU64_85130 [Paraburkholderia terrae]BDC44811.1 hypothetical protein PTKU15_81080 [Paraburkholderia terrae]